MLKMLKVLDRTVLGAIRKFKVSLWGVGATNMEQFHSGGDDYNPPANVKVASATALGNPRDGIVFIYQDKIIRTSALGEKRIYATDELGDKVVAEIHLKNNGDIVIKPSGKIITSGVIEHTGSIDVAGTVTADVVISKNGISGTYSNSVTSENGIVVGGT